jgi:hypothetical protein
MENKTINNLNFIETTLSVLKKRRKYIFTILTLILIAILIIIFLNFQQAKKNSKNSEQYIKANIYLTKKDKKNSKIIYKEIIKSGDKLYSILALNSILENDLEENNEEVLKMFKIVESIDLKEEKADLIKLKKALFLTKISKASEGNKLLKEIIEKDSVWGKIALEISK